jgi:hypothetical protein
MRLLEDIPYLNHSRRRTQSHLLTHFLLWVTTEWMCAFTDPLSHPLSGCNIYLFLVNTNFLTSISSICSALQTTPYPLLFFIFSHTIAKSLTSSSWCFHIHLCYLILGSIQPHSLILIYSWDDVRRKHMR